MILLGAGAMILAHNFSLPREKLLFMSYLQIALHMYSEKITCKNRQKVA
jgi:hypothetical protein